jgi:hypothetical protein
MQAHGPLQADIVDRQDVWPEHEKNQKHFRGPAADAFDAREFGNQLLVVVVAPGGRVERAVQKVFGQIDEVGRFRAGKPAGAQLRPTPKSAG